MDEIDGRPDAVLVAGPTASGKSAAALRLAERLGGAVVNADSMQVYDVLRIVTARPTREDEGLVPHRLYGVVAPGAAMSAARYSDMASNVLVELRERGTMPIFVGGTGLYFKALEAGLSPIPEVLPSVRRAVRSMNASELASCLGREDPEAAAVLRPSDTQRLARALEVVRSTGRSLVRWQSQSVPGPLAGLRLRRILLMPERSVLHSRIERRAAAIVADPAAHAEVRELLAMDPHMRSSAAKAIGVSQICALIHNTTTPDEAASQLATATRRYAKRQYTWFNNSLNGEWELRTEPGEEAQR